MIKPWSKNIVLKSSILSDIIYAVWFCLKINLYLIYVFENNSMPQSIVILNGDVSKCFIK